MCGIGASIYWNNVNEERLKQESKTLLHYLKQRGPDFQGSNSYKEDTFSYTVCHTRLSIIDVSPLANQPLSSNDERYTIIFNGEIYNYKQLRKQLVQQGASFKTNSDTEVLLHGYIYWGVDLLQKLRGMFAFVLLDKEKQTVFAARDRFGMKPLYFQMLDSQIIFSSTIEAIQHTTAQQYTINKTGLYENFNYTSSIAPNTIYNEIKLLQPGHYLLQNKKHQFIEQYYNLLEQTKQDYHSPVEQYEQYLKQSITEHLTADVPVSVSLSGGIDSTLLAYFLQNENVRYLTIGNEANNNHNESDEWLASFFAKQYQLKHQLHIVQPQNVLQHIKPLLTLFEEPINGLEPHFFLGQVLANQSIKTVMTGLGPDELLLGYKRDIHLQQIQQLQPLKPLVSLFSPFHQRVRKLHQVISKISLLERYSYLNQKNLQLSFFDLFMIDENDIKPPQFVEGIESLPFDQQLSFIELKTKIESHHALSTDKYLMHHGVEGRFPYLDHHIVEYQFFAPKQLKIASSKGKVLQRQLAKQYLPQQLVATRKKGFSIIQYSILENNSLQQYFYDEINRLQHQSLINKTLLQQIVKRPKEKLFSVENYSLIIYLLSLSQTLKNKFLIY